MSTFALGRRGNGDDDRPGPRPGEQRSPPVQVTRATHDGEDRLRRPVALVPHRARADQYDVGGSAQCVKDLAVRRPAETSGPAVHARRAVRAGDHVDSDRWRVGIDLGRLHRIEVGGEELAHGFFLPPARSSGKQCSAAARWSLADSESDKCPGVTAHGDAGKIPSCCAGWLPAQARIFAFSRVNSPAEMTPRSRRSASFASWSAEPAGDADAVSWT